MSSVKLSHRLVIYYACFKVVRGILWVTFRHLFFPLQILDTLDELLERKGDSEIVAIRDKITSKNTVAAILVMCDMLQPVNIFCKFLQGSAIDFSDVTRKLKVVVTICFMIKANSFKVSYDKLIFTVFYSVRCFNYNI